MSLRSIFLFAPAETARPDNGPVAYAMGLARAHSAHLTIFTVALDVTTPGRVTDVEAVAATLRAAAEGKGIAHTIITEHSHAIAITEIVAEHARVHDLSVAGNDDAGLISTRKIAEHLAFESGRPLILVPENHGVAFAPGTVGIAWDNTATAARALGDAIALLDIENALFVTIDGEKQLPGDLDPTELVAAAGRRGLVARHASPPLAGRTVGDALQQEARAAGAGLLVMGAFGHSRLRSFVLGGATRGVLERPQLPVLMSH